MKDKITAAHDCRSSLLGSLIAFKCAQEALPQVDIPHITNRQTVAVAHANEYLFTDIANPDRYQHTKHVLDAYQASLSQSVIWLHDVFQNTLKKDLQDAENDVNSLSGKLRQIRSDYIRSKVGYQNNVPNDQHWISDTAIHTLKYTRRTWSELIDIDINLIMYPIECVVIKAVVTLND